LPDYFVIIELPPFHFLFFFFELLIRAFRLPGHYFRHAAASWPPAAVITPFRQRCRR
jgi:hypothetical protein